jgi:uncharacterized protein YneF (UPF0154 family)
MTQYIHGIIIGLSHGILLGLYLARKNAKHPPAGDKPK